MDGLPQGFNHSAVLIDQGEYYNPNFIINGVKQQIQGYVSDLTTDMTLDWIAKRDTSKPFCVLYHQKRHTENGYLLCDIFNNIHQKPTKNRIIYSTPTKEEELLLKPLK
jgi:hypothetical protein